MMHLPEGAWFKSSHSTAGGECVEVAWHKSSYSAAVDNCVEVSDCPIGSAMRDSQHPRDGYLAFSRAEWAAFLHAVRGGEFGR